ncbi:MAG: tRNA (N6-threonylcarbamoyladenosine(37)-N6)-methyltransferase TrmO [Desulfurococcaceae archaeon]
MSICLKPIGYVRTQYSDDEVRKSINGVEGYIEVLEEYREGLLGLAEYSHIIVIAYLHKTPEYARKTLIVKPRKLLLLGFSLQELPEIGVFACDSPHRPNPVAITILEITNLKENKIYVKGLDLFNGTPVLDIKPYTPMRCIDRDKLRIPKWITNLQERMMSIMKEKEKLL